MYQCPFLVAIIPCQEVWECLSVWYCNLHVVATSFAHHADTYAHIHVHTYYVMRLYLSRSTDAYFLQLSSFPPSLSCIGKYT